MIYNYPLTAFPHGKVDVGSLSAEIQASEILVSLRSVNTDAENCAIDMRAELSVTDVAILDAIVAAHQAVPLGGPPLLVKIVT